VKILPLRMAGSISIGSGFIYVSTIAKVVEEGFEVRKACCLIPGIATVSILRSPDAILKT
jgi:hypothetical protein